MVEFDRDFRIGQAFYRWGIIVKWRGVYRVAGRRWW